MSDRVDLPCAVTGGRSWPHRVMPLLNDLDGGTGSLKNRFAALIGREVIRGSESVHRLFIRCTKQVGDVPDYESFATGH